MKFTETVRNQIKERSKQRCEVCTAYAFHAQIHHRKPRGMGGSKDPVSGSAANGLWVHPACHSKIESQRSWAFDRGYLVKQSDDPRTAPIKINGLWWLLDEEGNRKPSSCPSPTDA